MAGLDNPSSTWFWDDLGSRIGNYMRKATWSRITVLGKYPTFLANLFMITETYRCKASVIFHELGGKLT